MNILVCIKQVPDVDAHPEICNDSLHIREDSIAFRMNRYDEYALEEALLIKDVFPGTIIDIISAGSERAVAVLKKGLEKGADNAVLIKNRNCDSDPHLTASLISAYASGRKYDIIFAGVMSEDEMNSVTGPMIASFLAIPCAVSVVKSSIDFDTETITVDTELEGGMIETVNVSIPCLITVQTGINQPRYPSLSNIMRAKGLTPEIIDVEINHDTGLNHIISIDYPSENNKGIVIEGSIEEKADKLFSLLHEKGLL